MTNQKRKIDWLNHTLEFFVVIIGILLAFQLQKCSTNNTNRAVVDSHLEAIRKETEGNKAQLLTSIEHTEGNIAKLDTVLTLIEDNGDHRKINYLSLDLLNIGSSYLRKHAYQGLMETGDVKHIKDFSRKQKIINLYEYYKWVESFDELSSTLFSEDYYPYLKANFDFTTGQVQNPSIYYTKEFKNALAAYMRTSQNRLCLGHMENYLSDI